ncbi:MAG: D-2-hydroxyacid dehydrogenase [Gemmatimonadaceae bacterium]
MTALGFPLPFVPQRVLIGAGIHAALGARLQQARPTLAVRGALMADITEADVAWADTYIGFKRPPHVSSMGNVRWVHSTGAGVDGWLMGPPLEPQLLLTRSPELFGPMIAEWAVARVFAWQQQLVSLHEAQQAGRWAPRDIARVAGTRAVLVGTGDIGRSIATSLSALGVQCVGVSRSGHSTHPAFTAVHGVAALPALLPDADWVILSVPDTPDSRGLISRDLLACCRGAVLLNAGRGTVVDEAAIPEALDAGWLRGAALDVFATEPLPTDSPLWRDARVMVSPHISGLTTVDGAAEGFLECMASLARGELPTWVVDRQRGY